MKRSLAGAFALVALTACYHDNASPTYHGAHNKPGQGFDSTFASPQAKSDTTSSASYADSSANAGGIQPTVTSAQAGGSNVAVAPGSQAPAVGGSASATSTGARAVPTGQ